jgi:hypothetical protein
MRAALVALAVVLAGCPAFGSGSTPTPEVTPVPVPETAAYPPGVSEAGVVAPDVLANAHVTLVGNTSYTIVSNRTIRYANGTLASGLAVRTRLAADRRFLVTVSTAGPEGPLLLGRPPASARYWSNGSVYVRALTVDGRTTHTRFAPPDGFIGTWRYWRSTVPFGGQEGNAAGTFAAVFRAVPTTVADTRSVGNRTVTRLVGDTAHSGSFAKVGNGSVRNLTLAAAVDDRGLVRSFDLSYGTRKDDQPVRVEWSLRYLNVGNTTAARPPWFERAIADADTAGPPATAGQNSSTSTVTPS